MSKRPQSDWQLYNIPPPPRWLFIPLAAAVFAMLLIHNGYGATQRDLPGGYSGRPPTSPHWPGKCWCRYHGPRGGCMQWHCPSKRKEAEDAHRPDLRVP